MSSTARSALASFLVAFARLDLAAMLECLDQEATAFFPAQHRRERLAGKAAVGEAFRAVIARVRESGATSLSLDADELLVQEWGDTAVATFHLRDEEFCRRTVVLRHQDTHWRILHLHASNAPLEP
jgi:ketosteroid isomerase-like protein